MDAEAQPTETAEERRKRQMEGVPDLPPLLAVSWGGGSCLTVG